MKVLVFTSLYPNNIWVNHGVFIKERITQFVKMAGCEVKVIAPVPYFPPININWRWKFSQVARREIRDGLEIYHPPYFITPKFGMATYGWTMFLSVRRILKMIRKDFDFDLIDAHYVYPDGFAAIQLGRMVKKPVIVSARGSDVNLYKTFPVIRKLLRYVFRKADKIIAVSGALKETIARLGVSEEKITVIPNGVDGSKFRNIFKHEARRILRLPENCPVLLSVGGLTEVKGFDHLVRAFKIVTENFGENKPKLVVVGEGPWRNKLEALICNLGLTTEVSLVGSVPHEQLYLWYSAADLFCLASKREGWPNVVMEALACGTPVVGVAVGGVPDILASEDIGLLTGQEPKMIAARISEALQKNWDTDAISRYARRFSWPASVARVYDVFESVLKQSA